MKTQSLLTGRRKLIKILRPIYPVNRICFTVAFALLFIFTAFQSKAQLIYGLAGNQLISFDA